MSSNSRNSFKLKRRPSRLSINRITTSGLKNEKRWSYTNSVSEESENVNHAWTIEVMKNNLREELLSPVRRFKRSDSWSPPSETSDVKDIHFIGQTEANHLFLWVTFLGRFDLMKYLHENGADVSYFDESENLNALHLAALNGSVEICKWLLDKGCPIMQTTDGLTPMHYAVLGNSKELLEYLIQSSISIPPTVINSAVYANALECVKVLLSLGIDVNTYYDGMTALHVATDLRYINCIKELLNVPSINVNLKTENKGNTALHLAAESGYADCIELLLDKQARINEVNGKQQTALHLACKMNYSDCVEILLKNQASVNEMDLDHKTPLHAAVAKSQHSLAIVEMLVRWKANVNVADRYGYTPLHIAALNELEDCATFLILNGASVAAETKTGITALNVICRKTPASIPAIEKRFTNSLAYNSEQSLKFSFRELIFNSTIGEIGYLHTLLKENHKEMLNHPLCQAFLHLKWAKIKFLYFIRVFLVLLTACLLSFIVMIDVISVDCQNEPGDRNESGNYGVLKQLLVDFDSETTKYVITGAWIFLTTMCVLNVIRKSFCMVAYKSAKDYLFSMFNLTEFVLTILLLEISWYFGFHNPPLDCSWLKLSATASVLLVWTYLTCIIGELPFFATYITMFRKVFKELLKLLTVYLSLLMGFSFTFGVLFSHDELFGNPLTGFVRTLAMMTGELNLTELTEDLRSHHKIAVFLVLTLFIVLVTMALMNLLMGIAVNDVEGLQKTAHLSKLVHQTELMYFLEISIFHGYLPKKFTNFLKKYLHLVPTHYRVAIYVKPMSPLEKRLPKNIMNEALKLAINKNKPNESQDNEVDMNTRIATLEKRITEIDTNVVKIFNSLNDLTALIKSNNAESRKLI